MNVLTTTSTATTPRPALARRYSPLLAAAHGRQGRASRPAIPGRRAVPGPLSPLSPTTPHSTPVLTPAHPTPRAIRVRRSPR